MDITTQERLVFNHLVKNKGITSWEAINLYRITRLSAVIYNLRKRHTIISTPIDGTRAVRYVLTKQNQPQDRDMIGQYLDMIA